MNRNINSDSHRWPNKSFDTTTIKIVFPINDALALRLATTPKRDRLHEAYKGSTNINEFMVFRDHFGVSLSISFYYFGIAFPFLHFRQIHMTFYQFVASIVVIKSHTLRINYNSTSIIMKCLFNDFYSISKTATVFIMPNSPPSNHSSLFDETA